MTPRALTPQTFSPLYRPGGGSMALTTTYRYVAEKPVIVKGATGILNLNAAVIAAPIVFQDCAHLTILNGTVDGEKRRRGALWSQPAVRFQNCRDVLVVNFLVADPQGDGAYIAEACERITFRDFTVLDAYRNGVSIINGSHLMFDGFRIAGVRGQKPEAGVCVEANVDDPEGCNHDIRILNGVITDVGGAAIVAHGPTVDGVMRRPSRVTVSACELAGALILLGNDHVATGNRLDLGGRKEIGLNVRGQDNVVRHNIVTDSAFYAGLIAGPGSTVEGNIPRRCALPVKVEEQE